MSVSLANVRYRDERMVDVVSAAEALASWKMVWIRSKLWFRRGG
jgi:hypothetical protein